MWHGGATWGNNNNDDDDDDVEFQDTNTTQKRKSHEIIEIPDSSDENGGESDPALGTRDTSDAVSSGVDASSLVALPWSVPSFAGWPTGRSSR